MRSPSIVVVDYHKGNLSSVVRGFARAGAEAYASDDPACVRAADGIVIPGVGSFFDAITYMSESGLDQAVLDAAAAQKPILGICLGLQLLLDRGDEGVPEDAVAVPAEDAYGAGTAPATVFESDGKRWARGLGLVHGSCSRLESSRLKVPHVGWDQVHLTEEGAASPLLQGFPEGANMYFTHSYAADLDVPVADTLGHTHYTRSFACMVQHGRVFGCQFHPEKSSARGLRLIENFVGIVEDAMVDREVDA